MAAHPEASHQREVRHSDRRWLLVVLLVFTAGIGAFVVARWVYHLTGPHPEITIFVRPEPSGTWCL